MPDTKPTQFTFAQINSLEDLTAHEGRVFLFISRYTFRLSEEGSNDYYAAFMIGMWLDTAELFKMHSELFDWQHMGHMETAHSVYHDTPRHLREMTFFKIVNGQVVLERFEDLHPRETE